MKMKILIYTVTVACMGISCSINELDNYDAPNGGIYGTIIDKETGNPVPLPVQGSTGLMISIMEQGTDATKPVDFYAQFDGTYKNSKVFNCAYEVSINNGAFVEPVKVITAVNGQTQCDIQVIPLSRVEATASVSGKTVTVNYTITPAAGKTVSDVYGYWNFAPGVDDGTANKAGSLSSKNITGTFTFDLANDTQYKNNLHKIQANGNRIYLRVGSKVDDRINYSTISTVTVQ
jgi:hypothetical protein